MAEKSKSEDSNKKVIVEEKQDSILVKINPKIFPLPIIYQAADVFIDKHYVFIDGDPENEILVTIKPKNKSQDLEKIGGEFNNELLNYSAYFVRMATNRGVREQILKRAFFSVTEEKVDEDKFSEKLEEKEKIDIGIKVPIYGKNESKKQQERETSEGHKKPEEVNSDSEENFDLEDIMKPWEKQKGKIEESNPP